MLHILHQLHQQHILPKLHRQLSLQPFLFALMPSCHISVSRSHLQPLQITLQQLHRLIHLSHLPVRLHLLPWLLRADLSKRCMVLSQQQHLRYLLSLQQILRKDVMLYRQMRCKHGQSQRLLPTTMQLELLCQLQSRMRVMLIRSIHMQESLLRRSVNLRSWCSDPGALL